MKCFQITVIAGGVLSCSMLLAADDLKLERNRLGDRYATPAVVLKSYEKEFGKIKDSVGLIDLASGVKPGVRRIVIDSVSKKEQQRRRAWGIRADSILNESEWVGEVTAQVSKETVQTQQYWFLGFETKNLKVGQDILLDGLFSVDGQTIKPYQP